MYQLTFNNNSFIFHKHFRYSWFLTPTDFVSDMAAVAFAFYVDDNIAATVLIYIEIDYFS